MPDQERYYYCSMAMSTATAATRSACYQRDFYINCSGNCLRTADGTQLEHSKPFTVLACPPNFGFGKRLWIEGVGTAVCHDRGGAIKGRRLDLWAGIGDDGLRNIRTVPNGGPREVIALD